MNKLLTIGLAAAALAGGVAASSSPAMADDWNHRGYYDHGNYDRDHGRYDRDDWRRGHAYGYRHRCTHWFTRNPYTGRMHRHVACN